jgi:hypothetical protein
MPRERENFSKKIKTVDYKINGNRIRAYYDSGRELIFVLDETINADKPNVLLVIDSFDDRKWDDILSNDYGIDLETVRPKKDNKYQKLDIEYSGLDVYSELIDAYESDGDVDDALENLERFRIMAVRRAAQERLDAAEETATKARETIERTNDAISELRARIKELRAKLSSQKRNIGREPTKTSAAKILKTEAQIDAANEKLARAKKRLASAQRRLATAEDDAEIARAILARHADAKPVRHTKSATVARRRAPIVTEEVQDENQEDEDEDFEEYADDAPDEEVVETDTYEEKHDTSDTDEIDNYSEDYSETDEYETKADEVADEEVKPLFNEDPQVLDDNIAFKPIEFGALDTSSLESGGASGAAPAPLSFAPPVDENANTNNTAEPDTTPMLNSLTSVEQSTTTTTEETTQPETQPVSFTVETTPTLSDPEPAVNVQPTPIVEVAPVAPVEPVAPVRPVSPMAGNTYTQTEVRYTKKPTFVYYLMLILLIGLSIFTLWLYQKKNGAVVPDLSAPTSASETTTIVSQEITETNVPSPSVATVSEEPRVVAQPVEPEPVAEPEPEPVAEPEPEPVVEPEPETPAVAVESEPVSVAVEPPVKLRTVATFVPEKAPIPTEEEVLARKPGYNVSQQEKMFVSASDVVVEPEPVPVINVETTTVDNVSESGNLNSVYSVNTDVAYSMDTDVQPTPVMTLGPAPEMVASEVHEVVTTTSSDIGTCADGAPADANGCCPGEEFVSTPDGYMCCVDDDCFPPIQ